MKSTTPVPVAPTAGDHRHTPRTTPRILPLGAAAAAALGPTYLAICYGATSVIDAHGGVLGHKLTCKSVDTRGEPADAVPAVNQLFASTPNPALVIGCTSGEAASAVPGVRRGGRTIGCHVG
jgi:branched-chain amino acid transport system substrate-binding protein